MQRALFTTSRELSLASMDSGNTDSVQIKGRLSMRVMLGIAIALPIAAVFCLAYLTVLAFEAWRDATLARQGARSVPLQRKAWSGPARIAA
jgi:hypothetical protein